MRRRGVSCNDRATHSESSRDSIVAQSVTNRYRALRACGTSCNATKQVTGLLVDAGRSLEQNISLTAATVQLETQVVTASTERGSVNSALDAQRTAVGVVNSVTAEQISKSPDGDAAQAVRRVSGVTVQDGKYVFVRGLGERYTTSSLNGARVPSPEPERRVVPLDMFPAGLLQTITTSKTF